MIAVIPGHSASHRGAVAVDGVQEYEWQHVLACQVVDRVPEARMYERPVGPYREAMGQLVGQLTRDGAALVVELHFDAAPLLEAHGSTALHWPGSVMGEQWARRLSAAAAAAVGTRDRGARGERTSWAGAPFWLLRATKCPAVILETHFGTHAGDHARATAARDSGALADAIAEVLRGR